MTMLSCKTHKATKLFTCDQCLEKITIGSKYIREAHAWNGEFCEILSHIECHECFNNVIDLWDVGYEGEYPFLHQAIHENYKLHADFHKKYPLVLQRLFGSNFNGKRKYIKFQMYEYSDYSTLRKTELSI